MKFLCATVLAILALAAFVNADEESSLKLNDDQQKVAEAVSKECAEQEKVSNEKVDLLREGKFDEADENMKCFAKCFQEKLGFFVNGTLQVGVVKNTLSPIVGPEKLTQIMNKCNSGLKGVNDCDTAFKLFRCFYEEQATS